MGWYDRKVRRLDCRHLKREQLELSARTIRSTPSYIIVEDGRELTGIIGTHSSSDTTRIGARSGTITARGPKLFPDGWDMFPRAVGGVPWGVLRGTVYEEQAFGQHRCLGGRNCCGLM